MKKIFSITLALMLLLTACGAEPTATESTTAPTEGEAPIVNHSGKTFSCDLTAHGTVAADPAPVDSNSFTLCGKTYTMPIPVSQLIADGWKQGSGGSMTFTPGQKMTMIGYYLTAPDGSKIDLLAVYNDTDQTQTLEGTVIVSLRLHDNNVKSPTQLTIPGGICLASTAADVLEAFGRPDSTSLFKEYNNGEDVLFYGWPGDLPLEYQFNFTENGQLYNIDVEYVIDK